MTRFVLALALVLFALAACGTNVTLGTLPSGEAAASPVPGDEIVDAGTSDACFDDVCEPEPWDSATAPDDASAIVDGETIGDGGGD